MQIDPELGQQCMEHVSYQHEVPLICEKVDKINPQGKAQQRILFVTTFAIYDLKSKLLSKALTVQKRYSWLSITSIAEVSDHSFIVQFRQGRLYISHPQAQGMELVISSYLRELYRKDMHPKIEIREAISDFGFFEPSPSMRLIISMIDSGMKVEKGEYDDITLYFGGHPDSISLNQFLFPVPPELILDAISLSPRITTINVNIQANTDILGKIADHLLHSSPVTSLTFSKPLEADFSTFAQQIGGQSLIKSLTFKNFDLDERSYGAVQSLISQISPKLVIFDGCIRDAKLFVSKMSAIPKFSSIVELKFANIPHLDLPTLFPLFLRVRSLAFEGCDLDVCPALVSITASVAPNIENISLSSNVGMNGVFRFTSLPTSLRSMVFDDVQWKASSLIDLIRAITLLNSTVVFEKISFSHAHLSPSDWSTVFESLTRMNQIVVRQFCWDDNPLSPALIEFLQNDAPLENLSANGCFQRDDDLDLLSVLLSKSFNMNSFSFCCKEGQSIGKKRIETICKGIIENTTLTSIDMRGVEFGDDDLPGLAAAFLANRRISKLGIEFKGVKKASSLLGFMQQVILRGPGLKIDWPYEIVKRWRSDPSLADIARIFTIFVEGDPNIVPSPESVAIVRHSEPCKLDTKQFQSGNLRKSGSFASPPQPGGKGLSEILSSTNSYYGGSGQYLPQAEFKNVVLPSVSKFAASNIN